MLAYSPTFIKFHPTGPSQPKTSQTLEILLTKLAFLPSNHTQNSPYFVELK